MLSVKKFFMKDKGIKWRILFLMLFVFTAIGGLTTYLIQYQAKNQIILSSEGRTETFGKMFDFAVKTRIADLKAAIQFIVNDPNTLKAMAEGNRDFLAKKYVPMFMNTLKPKYGINIFQFHKAPAVSFLRVHKPKKFGDDLSAFRATVLAANTKGAPVAGIEVGKYGPSVRVVYPLSYQGKHVGTVELGADFAEIAAEIAKGIGTSFTLGCKAEVLKKAGFKLQTQTIEKNGEIFYAFSGDDMKKALLDLPTEVQSHEFRMGGRTLVASSIPLVDFSGKKVGEVIIDFDITKEIAKIDTMVLNIVLLLAGAIVLVLALIYYLFTKGLFHPLEKTISVAKTVAEGDLTQELPFEGEDEIGLLGKALNQLTRNFREIMAHIRDKSSFLAGQSEEFSTVAGNLDRTAQELESKAASVVGGLEEVTNYITDVSDAAKTSTENLDEVSQATLQMTNTIEEISLNTTKAQQISGKAVETAKDVTKTVNNLGVSAQEIHQVIDVINDIAEQTKLLALNATIEAARAGEAGKGFAVVANEVKELARQTNEATEDITQKIVAMQSSTEETVKEIENISSVIDQINEIVTSIATAVEEQTVAAQDISGNIGKTTEKVTDVAKRVSEAVQAIQKIEEETSKLNEEATLLKSASAHSGEGVTSLSHAAQELKGILETFKV